jgi:breast cancer 2 susceptibility protein
MVQCALDISSELQQKITFCLYNMLHVRKKRVASSRSHWYFAPSSFSFHTIPTFDISQFLQPDPDISDLLTMRSPGEKRRVFLSRPDIRTISDSSPARKRMRMSSPTYDEQVGDMSQEYMSAFDAIEARLSQQAPHKPIPNSHRRINSIEGKAGDCSTSLDQELLSSQDFAAQGDDNPFALANDPSAHADTSKASMCASFIKASAVIPPLGFKSASSLSIENVDGACRSPSPEVPPEVDYSSWFASAPSASLVGFQPATSRLAKENIFDASTVHTQSIGFTSVGKGKLIVPSSAALRKAEEKIKVWQDEVKDTSSSQHSGGFAPASFVQPPSSPRRTVLGAVQNSFTPQVPDTPTPAMATRKPFEAGSTFCTPTFGLGNIKGKQKAFKSPLISSILPRQPFAGAGGAAYLNSPLNPHHQGFASASSHIPSCSPAMPATPVRPSPSASVNAGSGFRPLGLTPRNLHGGVVKANFVTPFKPGVKPPELSASTTRQLAAPSSSLQRPVYPQSATQSPRPVNKVPDKGTGEVFNLGMCFVEAVYLMAQHSCYSPSRRKDDTCHFWSYATSLRNQRTEGSGNVS